MKPYARKDAKICINNRSKFNAGSRRISSEFALREWPGYIAPLSLMMIRTKKARRQGLTREQFSRYGDAML